MGSGFVLSTLGTLALEAAEGNDGVRPLLSTGKPAALLAYLALAPNRSILRDEGIDLLWSNVEVERGRRSLRQALFLLRSVLGPQSIASDGRRITLVAPLGVDALEFTHAAESDDRRAMELYTGPFLQGASFPGGAAFEHWAERERQRLESLMLHTSERLVQKSLVEGRGRDAVQVARRVRDLIPHSQAAMRLHLESLVATGDRTAAMVEAEAIDAWLQAEEEPPDASLAAVLRRLRQAERGPVAHRAQDVMDFVGRESELAELLKAYHGMVGGRSRHVHVSAPAGLGKTRLLAEAAGRLRLVRARVAVVAAVPSDRALPFSLLARVAEHLGTLSGAAAVSPASAALLIRLVPSLSSRFASGAEYPISDDELARTLAVRELLECVAAERPVTLIIDDLHWADRETLAALQRLADRPPANTLLLTAARPPVEVHGAATAVSCTLPPLTVEQVRALLVGLGWDDAGSPERPIADAMTRTSGGSPLLVYQLFRQGLDDGWLTNDDGEVRAPDDAVVVQALGGADPIGRRLHDLPAAEHRVVAALALAGFPLRVEVLAAAVTATANGPATVAEADTAAALQGLAARGLVTPFDDGWACTHDLVAERVVDRLGDGEAAPLHAALGRALASIASTPRALQVAARHLTLGEDDDGLLEVAHRYVEGQRRLGNRAAATRIVAASLGDEVVRRVGGRLMRRRPWHERIPRSLVASAILAAAAIGAFLLREPFRPTWRLVVAERPIIHVVHERYSVLRPPLVVELHDMRSNALSRDRDTVLVLLAGSGSTRIDTTRGVLRDGRVAFDSVVGVASSQGRLTVVTPRARAPLLVDAGRPLHATGTLRVKSFALDGATLTSTRQALRVPPSTFVHGWLTISYDTYYLDETVAYAGTTTWGDPAKAGYSFGVLSTPVVGRVRGDSIGFTTPTAPGTYHLVLVAGAESNADYLLSATNWTSGRPLWGDGNDVARWSDEKIAAAMRDGHVPTVFRRTQSRNLPTYMQQVLASAIRIVVDPSATRVTIE